MKQEEIVTEIFSALEKKNYEKVEKQLTDDFTFSGAVPQPITKMEWVNVQRALQSGVPDLKFNLHQVVVKGEKVLAKVQLKGTHTSEMPPTLPGIGIVPITGKKFELPIEDVEISFNGDKISGLYIKPTPHGGVNGILEQIGMLDKTTQANQRIVQNAFDDFMKGNIPAVLDVFSDQIEWRTFEDPAVPFAHSFQGKSELQKFFTLLDDNLSITGLNINEFISQGENVVVLVRQEATVKKTGKPIDQDICLLFKLRNGKIYSYFAFVDSRLESEAFR